VPRKSDNRSRRRNGNRLCWTRPGNCSSPRAIAVLGLPRSQCGWDRLGCRAFGISHQDDLFAAVVAANLRRGDRAEVETSDTCAGATGWSVLNEDPEVPVLHREAYERMDDSEALRAVYLGLLQWLEDLLLRRFQHVARRG